MVLNSRSNQYRISAVIPAYNREKTIKRCIDSVVSQTVPPYEIIVVDDGSSDGTLEVLEKEYADKVRIIRQNHRGAQAARNLGILNAEGDYIAFLDSDDEWLPDKLELQIEALRKNGNAVVYGGYYVQADWKGKTPVGYEAITKDPMLARRKSCVRNGKTGYVYDDMLKNPFCLFQTLLTSKGNLIEIGLLDENVPSYQEWDTSIRLAEKHEFIYIRNPLFIYHLHDGETISKNQKRAIDGLEYIYGKYNHEILGRLGNKELVGKHKQLMKICFKYRDKRKWRYLVKYALGMAKLFLRKCI